MLVRLLINLIKIYQRYLSFDHGLLMFLAPGGACRFSPSCSEYTKIQIEQVGVIKGIYLGVRRIIQCR